MALVPCPECGREVSTRASSCPGCGCPLDGAVPETTGSATVEARPPDPEVEAAAKLASHHASLSGGEMTLTDRTTQNIRGLIEECGDAFTTGLVRGLHLCGNDWCDDHVKEMIELLLPNWSASDAVLRRGRGNIADARSKLGNLTELRLTGCPRLTNEAMLALSKLSTLKRVHLTGWSVDGDDALAIMQMGRLPSLEVLEIPHWIHSHEVYPGTGIGYYKVLREKIGTAVQIK